MTTEESTEKFPHGCGMTKGELLARGELGRHECGGEPRARELSPAPTVHPEWPAALAHIPRSFRFVDAATGRPRPLLGIHFPGATPDAPCPLCGKAAAEILLDPRVPCV